jgi:hypothetical protein
MPDTVQVNKALHVQAAKVSSGDRTIIEKHLINDFAENEEERSRSY